MHLFCRASKPCEDIRARKKRHQREPNKQKGRVFQGPAFLFMQTVSSMTRRNCAVSQSRL
ncbi:hypothetical protein D1AOALGA4SA_10706 [Olavius algarvensis Delta 1 endosymbiont]|nr:hypothetical protein D1AOALGA4SA_10706 [Olavius algarvensis Delta 1 endosymbiont]